MDNIRADQLLFEGGQTTSRTEAQALIIAGRVFAGERRIEKPGEKLPGDTVLTIRGGRRYVSGGALKLKRGLDEFSVEPEGCVCLDLGASTGGFTEVLLERGARRVFAVDVGYGQLAASLRDDPRVIVLERTNARDLSAVLIPEKIDLLVADLSFISLRKVLDPCVPLLNSDAAMLVLFKPQFELGRRHVKKGGLALDFDRHAGAILEFADWAAARNVALRDLVHAPIRGRRKNVEYMLHLDRGRDIEGDIIGLVRRRVGEAGKSHAESEH